MVGSAMLADKHTFVVDVVNKTLWIVEIRLLYVVLVIVAVLLVLLFRHVGRGALFWTFARGQQMQF